MDFRADKVEASVEKLDGLIAGLLPRTRPEARDAAGRWRADAAALLFHLRRHTNGPVLVAVLGGTGTGKSTLVNRILGSAVSATSFRRTFTTGAVAIAAQEANVPAGWLGIEQSSADPADLPARGRNGSLLLVTLDTDLTRHLTLIDTPDLDGDQPAHHAEADRVFRWADSIVLLVTPEKYQMTELLPYYRLAARYRLPALFVMNKCEQQAVVEDYAKLLRVQGSGFSEERVFVVPRDDAGYEPPAEHNLESLRRALANLTVPDASARSEGLRHRTEDLLGRLNDQVLVPGRHDRSEIDRLSAMLRGLETPAPGVDVNPLTQQLQRRMQQRSVLYLMGPQRILDRLRQAPGLLVRLPRAAWDYVLRGQISPGAFNPTDADASRQVPDFRGILADQFAVVQSRLDDVLRTSDIFRGPSENAAPPAPLAPPHQSALIDPAEAGRIADEELAELKSWLEQRWNATPRDTRMLQSLLKHLPGGKKITQWTEAAPYLLVLAVTVATHHLFGGIDLAVLGGWSVATWLTERLSNEVASRTRQTNQRITDRFARLAHEQIQRICRWLDEQAPPSRMLDQLENEMEHAREVVG